MHSAVSDQTSSPLPARTGANGTQQPAVADIEPSPDDGAVRTGRAWLDSEHAVTMPGSRCEPANGWLVLVAGRPGSDKSTLAAALAAEPGQPLPAKDEIKEALAEGLGRPETVAASQRLGRAAVLAMLRTARTCPGAVPDSTWVRRCAPLARTLSRPAHQGALHRCAGSGQGPVPGPHRPPSCRPP